MVMGVCVVMGVQVKEAEELERAQRITEDKKHAVHDELIRKAIAKEVRVCVCVCVCV